MNDFTFLTLIRLGLNILQASMCRVCRSIKPDVIFLQETLVDEDKARHFMLHFVLSWYISVVSSFGNSGGLLVAGSE
jgi:hypothetical protein